MTSWTFSDVRNELSDLLLASTVFISLIGLFFADFRLKNSKYDVIVTSYDISDVTNEFFGSDLPPM